LIIVSHTEPQGTQSKEKRKVKGGPIAGSTLRSDRQKTEGMGQRANRRQKAVEIDELKDSGVSVEGSYVKVADSTAFSRTRVNSVK